MPKIQTVIFTVLEPNLCWVDAQWPRLQASPWSRILAARWDSEASMADEEGNVDEREHDQANPHHEEDDGHDEPSDAGRHLIAVFLPVGPAVVVLESPAGLGVPEAKPFSLESCEHFAAGEVIPPLHRACHIGLPVAIA